MFAVVRRVRRAPKKWSTANTAYLGEQAFPFYKKISPFHPANTGFMLSSISKQDQP